MSLRSTLVKWGLKYYGAARIKRAYEGYGYEQFLVTGPQGCGKTTYGLLIMYDIYRDWDLVLQNVHYDPLPAIRDLKRRLERVKSKLRSKTGYKRDRLPVVLFDDAGKHFSKYLLGLGSWYYYQAVLINYMFNTIRTVCAATIFTSPDEDILKEIRKKSWLRGEPYYIHGYEDPRREIRFLRIRYTTLGFKYGKTVFIDRFRVDAIPSDVRAEVDLKRIEAMEELYDELEDVINKIKEKIESDEKLPPKAQRFAKALGLLKSSNNTRKGGRGSEN